MNGVIIAAWFAACWTMVRTFIWLQGAVVLGNRVPNAPRIADSLAVRLGYSVVSGFVAYGGVIAVNRAIDALVAGGFLGTTIAAIVSIALTYALEWGVFLLYLRWYAPQMLNRKFLWTNRHVFHAAIVDGVRRFWQTVKHRLSR